MTVTINGTTGVDLIKDGSVLQADLAPNVAGNGPCFRVQPDAPQALATGTFAKILWPVKVFDTAGAFDAVTNHRFQPQIAGYYQITAGVYFGNTVTSVVAALYKNGVEYERGSQAAGATGTAGSNNSLVSSLVYLNGTTDYVEIFGSTTSAQSTSASTTLSSFNGFLARSA